jgi:hypothetical protein
MPRVYILTIYTSSCILGHPGDLSSPYFKSNRQAHMIDMKARS